MVTQYPDDKVTLIDRKVPGSKPKSVMCVILVHARSDIKGQISFRKRGKEVQLRYCPGHLTMVPSTSPTISQTGREMYMLTNQGSPEAVREQLVLRL
ncbi:hypothetical protein AVEN_81395-1 [Araneus ventricosus]|uniref:Uncharacterized protein n=1 Tax=Araneus ventricosus TaxID=182803 RepID=A0A4Y2B6Y2_ARAVE|nr:hypothetical protein AVEN_81395-1 [Araneus ventricosus]